VGRTACRATVACVADTAYRVAIYGLNKKKAPIRGAFSERNFKHKYNVKVSN
jgi:hypothetical protein